MSEAWVLWWRHSDGSGEEIIRAYDDEERANADFALVKEDAMRQWKLSKVEFYSEYD